MKINSSLKALLIILISIALLKSQAAKKEEAEEDCYETVKSSKSKPGEKSLFSPDLLPYQTAPQKTNDASTNSLDHQSDSREGDLFPSDSLPHQAAPKQTNVVSISSQTRQLNTSEGDLPSQEPLSNPDHSFQLIPHPRQQTRLTKTKKEEEQRQKFLMAFKNRNFTDMKNLVIKFPALKEVRFTSEEIPEWEPDWEQESWSPTQIAAHEKDFELLDFLLNLNMDIRSKKLPGGESVESNPLHISLEKTFKEGVERVLENVNPVPFGEKGRYIDEKDHLKRTPWFLAVKQDFEQGEIFYVHMIGEFEPSGHVDSYTQDGRLVDGFEIVKLIRSTLKIDDPRKELAYQLKELAYQYLKTIKYLEYKARKWNYPNSRARPPIALRTK